MKKYKVLFILLSVILLFSESRSQFADIKFKTGEYVFQTKFDTASYTTQLKIKKNKKTIFKETYPDGITGIREYDLDYNGKKEILIEMYSGGAHCCSNLYVGEIANGKFNYNDSILWGNSFYGIEDLNNDKKFEISGVNDMFAYAFTNYAQSQFNILIYGYENKKFVNVTKSFPAILEAQIGEMIKELKPYQDSGFKCPELNEDTFNTDAGAVKAILAVIVADYGTLGEIEKGYEYLEANYNCQDKEKFIEILNNDFKQK
ncbi:MAG TPA: hypothetical protein PKD83_00710 [Ignavibacteria bacterium]|nr:hypothetical protein [Ignavibacteria bacterium]